MPDLRSDQGPIKLGQRLVGLGTILIGALAFYACTTFVSSLWDTPQRNLGIGVTLGAVLMICVGIVIGFPDKLPRNLVAMTMLIMGLLSILVGVLVICRCIYNVLFEPTDTLLAARISMSTAMLVVGYGFMTKAFNQLRSGAREHLSEK